MDVLQSHNSEKLRRPCVTCEKKISKSLILLEYIVLGDQVQQTTNKLNFECGHCRFIK